MADLYYIETGYFDPELGYYVYTADAALTVTSTVTLTATVGTIKQAASTQSSAFTITATISNVKGVDIVLTPFATVSANVNVVRDAQSTQSSTATETVSADRFRDTAVSLSDAFAFTAVATGGNTQNASASISSAFTVSSSADVTRDFASNQTSAFAQITAINFVADAASSQSSAFSQSATATRIQQGSAVFASAMTASMTVNVRVNPFATLDSSAVMTTDFVVNRSAAITLNNIVTLSSQGIRSAGLTSTQSSAFTQSTSTQIVKVASSALTSSATLTAQGKLTKQLSTAISSSASLSASVLRVTRTAMLWQLGSGGELTTAQKKFGSGAIRGLAANNTDSEYLYLTNSSDPGLDFGAFNFTADMWMYQTADMNSGTGDVSTNIFRLSGSGSILSTRLIRSNATSKYRFDIRAVNTSNANITVATGSELTSLALNTWHHIRFCREGNIYSVWFNGTRVAQGNSFGALRSGTGVNQIRGWRDYHYFDEFRLYTGALTSSSTTSFTSPTSAFTNDSSTISLLHFDGTVTDDNIAILRTGSASISSTATLSANAGKSVRALSTQSATATLTASAVRTRTASAALAAQGFVVTVAGYRLDDLADLTSTSSLTANANKTTSAVSTQSATASLSAVGGYLKSFESQPFVEFHVDADIALVAGITETYTSAFTQTASAERLRGFVAQLAAEGFVLTVAGTQQTGFATLSVVSTVSASVNRTRDNSSSFTASASMTINVGEVVQFSADLNSAFAHSAVGQRIRFGVSTQASTISQITTAIKTSQGFSSLSAQNSLSATVVRTRDSNTFLDTFVVSEVQGNYRVDNTATQSSQASLTNNGNRIASAVIAISGQVSTLSIIAYTSTTSSNMTTAAAMNVSAVKTSVGVSTQSSAFAQTTQPLRIQQYVRRTIDGAETSPSRWLQYVDSSLEDPAKQLAVDTVISFWARRPDRLETEGTYIYNRSRSNEGTNNAPPGTPPNYNDDQFILGYENDDNFIFRAYNAGVAESGGGGFNTNINFTWQDVVPTDTEWHHYLVHITQWSGAFPGNFGMRLWIDGDYKSIRTATGPGTYNHLSFWYTPLDIGYGSRINIAQIWAGQYDLDNTIGEVPTAFYNTGWVDMPANGAIAGSTPYVYALLDDPFSNKLQGVYDPQRTDPADEQIITIDSNYLATYRVQGDSSQFQISIIAQAVQVFNVQYNSAFTQTTQARKTAVADCTQSATAQLTALTRVNKTFTIALNSAFSQTALTGNVLVGQSTQSAQFTVVADGDKINAGSVSLSSAFTVLAISGTRADAQSALTAASTISVSANKVKDVFISVGSNCATTASAVKTARAQFNQASTAALNATAQKIRATRIDIASDFALSTQARKTSRAQSTITSAFTQVTRAGQIKGTSVNLTAFYTQLTVGDVIQLDPYTTYLIPAETGIFKISRETRIYTLDAETRVNIIQGYNL